MPIPSHQMASVLVVDETTTVRQAVGALLGGEPYNQWSSVVVWRAESFFEHFLQGDLNIQPPNCYLNCAASSSTLTATRWV